MSLRIKVIALVLTVFLVPVAAQSAKHSRRSARHSRIPGLQAPKGGLNPLLNAPVRIKAPQSGTVHLTGRCADPQGREYLKGQPGFETCSAAADHESVATTGVITGPTGHTRGVQVHLFGN